MLDVGCGSGLLSLAAVRAGAVVTAVDINDAAVAAAAANAVANALVVETLRSDLFDALLSDGRPGRRFDLIVVNPPYFAKDPVTDAERAFFAGVGLGYFERFFAGLAAVSNAPAGTCAGLMVLGEACDLATIGAAAHRHGWTLCETQRRRVWLGEQVIYELVRPLARSVARPDAADVPDVSDVGDAAVVVDMTVVDVSLGAVSFRAEERSQERYGSFWATFAAGTFEPATVSVLEAELGPGRRFLDIGAWIGPFTLLANALGAQVTAFEPDPVAVAALRNNLALNASLAERVEVRPVAVAASAGSVRLDGGTLGLGNGLSRVRLGRPASWWKGWRKGWPARLLGSARTAPAGADTGGILGRMLRRWRSRRSISRVTM